MRTQYFKCFRLHLVSIGILGTLMAAQGIAQTVQKGASHKVRATTPGDLIPGVKGIAGRPLQPEVVRPSSRGYSQFAPYYTVADGFMTMLMLNNATQADYSVKVTLYSLEGQAAELPLVHLSAHETKDMNLNEWVAGLGSKYVTGSLRLDYTGMAYALGAMVMMVNEPESVEIDVLARPRFEFKSNRLEAMWWMPEPTAEARYALQNTTDKQVRGKLSLTDGEGNPIKSLTLEMSPNETRVYKLQEILDEAKTGSAKLGGISIDHLGKPGDLMAQCFVLRRNKGFSASLQFEDPKSVAESTLEGAGILLGSEGLTKHAGSVSRIESFSGHLLVRNISTQAVTINPQVQRAGHPNQLPEVKLQAGEAKDILVPSTVSNEAGAAGIGIHYTGEPGSVLAYWFSVDRSGSLVVETPLRSPATLPQAGSNPWSLEGDSTSVLYVKNTATISGSFVAELFYRGGEYMVGMRTVDPGETAAIDIRKLRDEQMPDVNGNKLPLDVTVGQINWRTRNGSPRLIGRVNTMSISKGLANNMSCSACCNCPSDVSLSLTPTSWSGLVGGSFSLTPWETDTSGCGTQTYPISVSSVSWSSDASSVASANQSAVVSCTAGGLANIAVDASPDSNVIDNSIDPAGGCWFCDATPTPVTGITPTKVLPHIDSLDPDIAMIGSHSVQITINGSGFTGNNSSAPQVVLPAGFTTSGQGNTDTRIVITVDIGLAATIGLNNISVTTNQGGSNQTTFSVNGPHQMVVQSDVIGTSTNNPHAQSRFVTYQVQNFDQTLLTAAIPIAEAITFGAFTCTQPDPGNSTSHCDGTDHTGASGIFTDEWGMYTGFTPAGCGKTITDHWQWCGPTAPAPNPGKTFGTLAGFIHTSDSQINGFTNPPNPMGHITILP